MATSRFTDIAEDYTELLDDSPHDIFRADRGRYPRLVHRHAGRADRDH
jgi:hypothetical protein